MNTETTLSQLDQITKLKVTHSRTAIKAWYESYYDEKANEWFNKRVNDNELEYDFIISYRECQIRIYLLYWGWTDLIKESGKTTEQACQKAIKKFYKNYKR